MLSELPVGERLALKGQLFELSKKLSLIELERQVRAERVRLGLEAPRRRARVYDDDVENVDPPSDDESDVDARDEEFE